MGELTLEAKVDHLEQVLAFVDKFLEDLDCSPKAQMQIDVAVEELFVNIAGYAYAPGTGDMTIRIDAASSGEVAITLIDSGVPFNPLDKTDPDVTLSAEQRQIGGLGIYMVKKSMDSMEYERRDGKNILKIKKHLG